MRNSLVITDVINMYTSITMDRTIHLRLITKAEFDTLIEENEIFLAIVNKELAAAILPILPKDVKKGKSKRKLDTRLKYLHVNLSNNINHPTEIIFNLMEIKFIASPLSKHEVFRISAKDTHINSPEQLEMF